MVTKLGPRKTLYTPEHIFNEKIFTGERMVYLKCDNEYGMYRDNYKTCSDAHAKVKINNKWLTHTEI